MNFPRSVISHIQVTLILKKNPPHLNYIYYVQKHSDGTIIEQKLRYSSYENFKTNNVNPFLFTTSK